MPPAYYHWYYAAGTVQAWVRRRRSADAAEVAHRCRHCASGSSPAATTSACRPDANACGAGIVVPLPDDTCALGEVSRVMHYLAAESAGQCGPCRLGMPEMARLVNSVLDGTGSPEAVHAVAGAMRGRGACSHPDGASRFALSALETFAEDVSGHLYHNGCGRPVRCVLPVPEGPDGGTGRLEVDWSRCDGHGLCAHILPEMVRLDGNRLPAFPGAPVPTWLEPQARRAVDMCPALALRLTGSARPADNGRRARDRRAGQSDRHVKTRR